MNKAKNITAYLLTSLVLTSCMKISKKNTNQQTPTLESSEVSTPIPIEPAVQIQKKALTKLEFEITSEGIQFLFPQDWPEAFFVEVIDSEQHTTIPLNLNSENKSWSFNWPAKDRKFGFIFRSTIDKNIPPLKSLEALPPLNIATDESVDIVSQFGINSNFEKLVFSRLHLLKSAKLYLRTFSGEVILNDVLSEAGSIQTFPTNSKANLGIDGISGGRVEFKILSGQGRLSLMALGQHGGDGQVGPAPDESLRGRQGEPGKRAEFGPAGSCIRDTNPYCIVTIYPCIKDPTNSSPGYQGQRGFRGYPGRNGGDSGLYSVQINTSHVKTNVVAKEGLGGRGGYGGDGGEGGLGGEIGDGAGNDFLIGKFNFTKERIIADKGNSLSLVNFLPACQPAKIGATGPKGPQGDQGADGLDGINEILASPQGL